MYDCVHGAVSDLHAVDGWYPDNYKVSFMTPHAVPAAEKPP